MLEKDNGLWYRVIHQKRTHDGDVEVEIKILDHAGWFDGHFPGNPVLPGIAQLAVVNDILKDALEKTVRIERVSRVRFKQMVRPMDTLLVIVKIKENSNQSHGFRMMSGRELVCSGFVKIKEIFEDDIGNG